MKSFNRAQRHPDAAPETGDDRPGKPFRKISAVLAAAALAPGLLIGVAAESASAAVPSCVYDNGTWTEGSRTYVQIKNNCTSTQRYIVRWSWAFDSSCQSHPAKTTKVYSKLFSSFEGLGNC